MTHRQKWKKEEVPVSVEFIKMFQVLQTHPVEDNIHRDLPSIPPR